MNIFVVIVFALVFPRTRVRQRIDPITSVGVT